MNTKPDPDSFTDDPLQCHVAMGVLAKVIQRNWNREFLAQLSIEAFRIECEMRKETALGADTPRTADQQG